MVKLSGPTPIAGKVVQLRLEKMGSVGVIVRNGSSNSFSLDGCDCLHLFGYLKDGTDEVFSKNIENESSSPHNFL